MKVEKLAGIGLAVIIIGALSAYLLFEYNDEIFESLTYEKKGSEIIELGDCADVDLTIYFSNGTAYATSSKDIAEEEGIYDENFEAQGGYEPWQIFLTHQWNDTAPEGYENYSMIPIKGLMEGLIGLKEGQETSIGPISPEKGFGVKLAIGDIIDIDVPAEVAMYGIPEMHDEFIDIIEDASVDDVPADYLYFVTGNTTTLYVGKDITQKLGDIRTDYPCWSDATVATKTNDTHIWWETQPPADKIQAKVFSSGLDISQPPEDNEYHEGNAYLVSGWQRAVSEILSCHIADGI